MYSCPTCQQPSISLFHKWSSCRAFPATCTCCGAQSVVATSNTSLTAVIFIAVVMGCGFIAAAFKSLLILLIGILLAFFCYGWRWHAMQLQLITDESVAKAKKENNVICIIFVLSCFFQ